MRTTPLHLCVLAVSLVVAGCSGSDASTPPGAGGDNGVGGSTVAGGSPNASSGGTSAVGQGGGNAASGGAHTGGQAPTGGNVATGGIPSNNAGGMPGTGGAKTGGAPTTGGSLASNTGGKAATGGAPANTGGAPTGGKAATGGSLATNSGGAATGGKATTGGAATGGAATGGKAATGGAATGGKAATGGAATGGKASTGGAASCGNITSSCTAANQTISSNASGTHCGYTYEYWKDTGTGSLILKPDGFSVSWSGINNLLGRKGIRPGSANLSVTFDANYQPVGNSYLCVYGWTRSPLIEYYIVDSWGTWRPPGGTSVGTVTSDGGTYDIYKTQRVQQPSIDGTQTFYQYWSVRTAKRTCGTITVANHFNAWKAQGLTLGTFYEVSMTVEGYQSSGTADVKMLIQ